MALKASVVTVARLAEQVTNADALVTLFRYCNLQAPAQRHVPLGLLGARVPWHTVTLPQAAAILPMVADMGAAATTRLTRVYLEGRRPGTAVGATAAGTLATVARWARESQLDLSCPELFDLYEDMLEGAVAGSGCDPFAPVVPALSETQLLYIVALYWIKREEKECTQFVEVVLPMLLRQYTLSGRRLSLEMYTLVSWFMARLPRPSGVTSPFDGPFSEVARHLVHLATTQDAVSLMLPLHACALMHYATDTTHGSMHVLRSTPAFWQLKTALDRHCATRHFQSQISPPNGADPTPFTLQLRRGKVLPVLEEQQERIAVTLADVGEAGLVCPDTGTELTARALFREWRSADAAGGAPSAALFLQLVGCVEERLRGAVREGVPSPGTEAGLASHIRASAGAVRARSPELLKYPSLYERGWGGDDGAVLAANSLVGDVTTYSAARILYHFKGDAEVAYARSPRRAVGRDLQRVVVVVGLSRSLPFDERCAHVEWAVAHTLGPSVGRERCSPVALMFEEDLEKITAVLCRLGCALPRALARWMYVDARSEAAAGPALQQAPVPLWSLGSCCDVLGFAADTLDLLLTSEVAAAAAADAAASAAGEVGGAAAAAAAAPLVTAAQLARFVDGVVLAEAQRRGLFAAPKGRDAEELAAHAHSHLRLLGVLHLCKAHAGVGGALRLEELMRAHVGTLVQGGWCLAELAEFCGGAADLEECAAALSSCLLRSGEAFACPHASYAFFSSLSGYGGPSQREAPWKHVLLSQGVLGLVRAGAALQPLWRNLHCVTAALAQYGDAACVREAFGNSEWRAAAASCVAAAILSEAAPADNTEEKGEAGPTLWHTLAVRDLFVLCAFFASDATLDSVLHPGTPCGHTGEGGLQREREAFRLRRREEAVERGGGGGSDAAVLPRTDAGAEALHVVARLGRARLCSVALSDEDAHRLLSFVNQEGLHACFADEGYDSWLCPA